MSKVHPFIACGVFAIVAAFSGAASATNNIELVYSGLAEGNTSPPLSARAFTDWCQGNCFPTVQQPVYDASTGQRKGTVNIWGKPFSFGTNGSLCFSEFSAFTLDQGAVYLASGPNGTCGAPIDPNLKAPKFADHGALVVIAGGGDGTILGGTGKYAQWTGTFTDRVFVGFGVRGTGALGTGIIYYDQLWFSISGK